MWGFQEKGKQKSSEKNPYLEQDANQQQTQSIYGNRQNLNPGHTGGRLLPLKISQQKAHLAPKK